MRRQTTYENYEILVVDNGSCTALTLDYLRAHENVITIIRDERAFNYSALNNGAAEQAGGELLLLLNDDVEVMGGDWLEEMVSQVLRPGVGIVGAKLDYPNGTIQHAGVTLGIYGVAGHLHKGRRPLRPRVLRRPGPHPSGLSGDRGLHADPPGGLGRTRRSRRH